MSLPSVLRRSIPCVALALFLTTTGPAAGASDLSSTARESHCVVYVTGQSETGEYFLSDEECFSDFGDAMQAAGLGDSATTAARAESAAAALSSTLAVHYDGLNYTGSSTSVVGVDCLGGYINVSAAWDNRVSSTFGGLCPRIRHWTGANKTGVYQDTTPHGNLTTLNNAATSIQYLT